jgi:hypothetical protein
VSPFSELWLYRREAPPEEEPEKVDTPADSNEESAAEET